MAADAAPFPLPSLKFRTAGFSPVRLQTGCRSGTFVPGALSPGTYNHSQVLVVAGRHSCRTESAWPSSIQNLPVQRPLARRRVIVSRQVIAYYGLIRGSGLLPAAYGFPFRSPGLCFTAKAQRFPNLSGVSFCPCRLPYHGGRMASDCCSSIRSAFALFGWARRPRVPTQKSVHAWCAFSRLQNSLYAAARTIASPAPTPGFYIRASIP